MNDFERVFYHELGHFTARELNAKYYKGAPTKSFEIFLHDSQLGLYCGELKVDKSNHPDEGEAPKSDNLATYLASSSYGCFFQSLHLDQSLNDCFNRNGQDDYVKWMSSLTANKLSHLKAEFVDIEKKYFESLKCDPSITEILKINQREFLSKPSPEAQNFYADIKTLRETLEPLIDQHYTSYQKLIKQYQQLIDAELRKASD